MACLEACPFGAIFFDSEQGVAIMCDLCGGDPACVKRCATGAIRYGKGDVEARWKREQIAIAAAEAARDV